LQEEAFAALDPVLLELCRLRIATLLGDTEEQARRAPAALEAGLTEAKVAELPSWPDSPLFDERERACLAFTEMFVGDVSGITDADAAAVLEALGPARFHGFTTSLLAFDQHQRLRLAMLRVLGAPEDAS
ncbi:carboxymuconolactone decarboxylase family protein, partial [Acinetobacter sp. GC2]|uniref:carboxymuconolactone decarboxylase family protein n=1 Tax=Acinetobacter lwoffii TaxID=28090 RepID=UPI0013E0C979